MEDELEITVRLSVEEASFLIGMFSSMGGGPTSGLSNGIYKKTLAAVRGKFADLLAKAPR